MSNESINLKINSQKIINELKNEITFKVIDMMLSRQFTNEEKQRLLKYECFSSLIQNKNTIDCSNAEVKNKSNKSNIDNSNLFSEFTDFLDSCTNNSDLFCNCSDIFDDYSNPCCQNINTSRSNPDSSFDNCYLFEHSYNLGRNDKGDKCISKSIDNKQDNYVLVLNHSANDYDNDSLNKSDESGYAQTINDNLKKICSGINFKHNVTTKEISLKQDEKFD